MSEVPARDEVRIDRYRADLMNGAVFARADRGHGSEIGYRPPCNRQQWSEAMKAMAEMARVSDPLAQVAAAVIGRVNLYGTAGQACSAMYRYAGEALARGYTDVIRRAGPEPGRPSDSKREFTLAERVAVAYWLLDACSPYAGALGTLVRPGWCLVAIAEEIGYRHPERRR